MTQEPATQPIPRGEPLREAVYARVVDLILSGRYPPGAALTEAALTRALQVSRTPIREALLRLEAEEVLSSALAQGFTVRPLVRREVTELYPILASLEGLAIRTAPTFDAPALTTLAGALGDLEGCTDPVGRWRLDSTWHGILAAITANDAARAAEILEEHWREGMELILDWLDHRDPPGNSAGSGK